MHLLIFNGIAAVAAGLIGGRIVLDLMPAGASPRPAPVIASVIASPSSPVPSVAPALPASTNAPAFASAPPTHAVDTPALSPEVPPAVVAETKADRAVVTGGKRNKQRELVARRSDEDDDD
jgi:hypothetical protein